MDTKRDYLVRILIGGLAGVLVLVLIGALIGSFSLFGGSSIPALNDLFFWTDGNMEQLLGAEWIADLVQALLFFTMGALAGLATLPFAETSRELAVRSLLHFAATEAVFCLGFQLNFPREDPLPWMAALALLYVTVWLGRWVGWCAELDAIREKLGLAPAPSFLKWRETLPHLGFALVLCLVLPLVLRLADAPDVPLLTQVLYPWVLLPVGGFVSGMSLGKRKGFCPLYPAACGVLSLISISILYHNLFIIPIVIAVTAPLLGVSAGTAVGRARERG